MVLETALIHAYDQGGFDAGAAWRFALEVFQTFNVFPLQLAPKWRLLIL
jgi:hypothetical protein